MAPRAARVSASVLLAFSFYVQGGEYEKSANIQVGGYHTSNVCLVDSGEDSEIVGTFTPSVRVNGGGSRSTLRLSASAEYNSLADSDVECAGGIAVGSANREAWVPNINLYADYEALEDWLDFYVSAVGTQSPVNPFRVGGDDNTNGLGNTNVIYQWTTGARVERGLTDTLLIELDYAYNEQYNSVNQVIGDSQEHRFSYDIGTDPFSSRVNVGSRGRYSEVEFVGTPTAGPFSNQLSRAEVYAGLALQRTLLLESSVGIEDNVFTSSNANDVDGEYWDLGLRWSPTERAYFSVGYGERFFGAAPRFEAEYRHKRSSFSAAYLKDIQFPRNIRTDVGDPLQDEVLVPPVTDVPGLPAVGLAPPTFAGNAPVLNESFSLRYQTFGHRTDLEISGRYSQQQQLNIDALAEFRSANARLTRQLSPRTTGSVSAGWQKSERISGPSIGNFFGAFEGWTFDLGVRHSLQRRTSVSLRYRFSDRQSDEFALNNFEEHRVTLLFTFAL